MAAIRLHLPLWARRASRPRPRILDQAATPNLPDFGSDGPSSLPFHSCPAPKASLARRFAMLR